MKKGLVIGGVLLACTLVFMGVAQASETSTSGRIEFKIEGSSEEGEASGVFDKGTVRIDYKVSLTSGPFEAVLIPRFNLPSTLSWDDAYIAYDFDSAVLEMHPLGIDLDLYSIGGDAGEPEIPKNAGIKFEIPVAPLTLELIVNNQAVGDQVEFNYALEAEYEVNSITIGGLFGSTGVETEDWYGSFYGLQVEADLDPLALTVQYGSFSPETTGLEDGSGYFAEVEYDVEGLGLLTLSYTGADKNLNGAGIPTDKEYSEIGLEFRRTLADDVYLYLGGSSIEPGTGVDSYSEYYAKMRVNF